MQVIFFISTLLAATLAEPAILHSISSQYHSQNGQGEYSYGYSNDLSSKSEVRAPDGTTRGSYSYVDAEGKLQSVEYSSDAVNGFRVAATNLPGIPTLAVPLPVQDTPEVAEAKLRHFAAVQEIKARIAQQPEVKSTVLTTPVLKSAHGFTYTVNTQHVPYYSYHYTIPYIATPVIVGTTEQKTEPLNGVKVESA